MADKGNGNGKRPMGRTGTNKPRSTASGAKRYSRPYTSGSKSHVSSGERPHTKRPVSKGRNAAKAKADNMQEKELFIIRAVRWVKNLNTGKPISKKKERYKEFQKEKMVSRNKVLLGVLTVCFVVLIGFLAYYQIFGAETWKRRASNQQLKDTVLNAKRGTIYDANMETLVQSSTAWKVWVKKEYLKEEQKDGVVQMLSEVLGYSEDYVRGRLAIKASDISFGKKITKEQKDIIDAYIYDEKGKVKVRGIYMEEDSKRNYFRGSLASTVLGFTNAQNEGASGIEKYYDKELSGVSGRQIVATDANSNAVMPFDYSLRVDPQEGSSLVLTIDATVQQCLEKNLRQAISDNKVRNKACGIIMNVNTGEILAMATMPDYDPAEYSTLVDRKLAAKIEAMDTSSDEAKKAKSEALASAQEAQWRNKCIAETYEPGSVFKPITMAAALEEGAAKMSDSFSCHGYLKVNGRKISCARTNGHGSESLTKGMMNSCNPVFMTLISRLGASKFYQYFTAFGLTEKTGVDLPLESSGIMHTEKVLKKESDTLAVCSFGQSFKITPLQMVTAIAATCNGGYLVQPHVASKLLDSDGNIIKRIETTVKRQVISEKTSKLVNGMLEKTVSGGTAKNGYIAGYRLGGKTGTSEKIQEMAQTGVKKYIASYCAIAPSDKPEIVMLVLLDEPNGAAHTGGTIAAPVVRNTLKDVLPYLGIDTVYTSEEAVLLNTVAPNVQGRTLAEAKSMLDAKGLKYRVTGNGETVTAQIPQGGKSLPKNSTVVLNTDDGDFPMTTVPDVTNMSASKANKAITNAKLNICFAGTGYDSKAGVAIGQYIQGGTRVEQGTVITVEFIESGIND